MTGHFDLVVTTHEHTAEFELRDGGGNHLAFHSADFSAISPSRRQSLFDLGNYLRLYVETQDEAAEIAAVGVCIAEQVLGEAIFKPLWEPQTARTLRIQLPGAAPQDDSLTALLANVPWEIARPSAAQKTLAERNLLLRIVHDSHAPAAEVLQLPPGEPLRVLFVFAEARGSNPLGARRERLELLDLFRREIYPQRGIVAHFLTHGVTRERLKEQIAGHGGYHAVHWSGHGNLNLLELAKSGGARDSLSGEALLALFMEAGGFLPRLFFLSACHSGDVGQVRDWDDFQAVAQGRVPGRKTAAPPREMDISAPPGYTGTAHALLQGGVPSVVAMRYAVGDDYARELAVEFYRALLAHPQPKNPAQALALARKALLDADRHDLDRYAPCDHATPLLYGAESPGLAFPVGRSPELDTRNPRLNPVPELGMAEHRHFVGRTWELAGLGAEFIGTKNAATVKPVAVITGLGGMGKTALAAEALALWEKRFAWVLIYQAKPNALSFDATLRDIHTQLNGELGRYHEHVQAHRSDAIHREADAEFNGTARQDRLIRNLLRAMQDEAILLVLDNFEGNLKAPTDGQAAATCQDPAWERCLAALAVGLAGTASRLLITCRRPLAVLADNVAHPVRLGPLPPAEAALFLREHPALSAMLFGADNGARALTYRLLNASRFHPLLMDRLARLAADVTLRPQLLAALDTLETTGDFAHLPELFAATPGDKKELDYLNDALAASLDQLIRSATPDARRLLWMIAIANEPVDLELLNGVWSGEDFQQQQLREIKQMLDILPQLPPELQAKLQALPPEVHALLDALPPPRPTRPDPAPLLAHLVSVGLVTAECRAPDTNPDLTCHELVRERIRDWMAQHPQDKGDLSANSIRLAYAERLEALFNGIQHRNLSAALQAGSRALVYCVQAEAWDQLGGFASGVVTGTGDPRLLAGLLPHLHAAAESAPEGGPRWSCLGYLADALARGSRPDASLAFYEQAATQARAVAEAGGDAARLAWAGYAWIAGNWANALAMTGNLDAARQRQLDSAAAKKQAGRPAVNVIASELEALRIDIRQGKVATALPEVETRLAQIASWWQQHRSGEHVAEAPDAELLARAYISALDIAKGADFARQDWSAALPRIDIILEVKRALKRPAQDIAGDRMNRANVLTHLGGYAAAQAEMEACLALFQGKPDSCAKVYGSLANLFDEQGDVAQAITQVRRALALREDLPDPAERAISHHNLANYLERNVTPSDRAESPRHQLAALVYRLVAGLGQHLQTSLHNYAIRFRDARQTGGEPAVPRLAVLLADPAFHPLQQWLAQRQEDVDELQTAVDELLDQARQAAQQP